MKNIHFRSRKSVFTFATVHENLDELQGDIRGLFEKHLNPSEDIRTIISAPSQLIQQAERRIKLFMPWKTTPSWVLVMTDQRMLIAVIPSLNSEPVLKAFSFDHIMTMELGRVLLFAWLEWSWVENGGVDRLRVYFNAVDDKRYHDLVKSACRHRIEKIGYKSFKGQRNLKLLKDLPYKFNNIITIELLLTDEAIQELVYRPAIYDRILGLFRNLRSPATALLRTNYHLLFMREDVDDAGSKYGVVFGYMPLDVIQKSELLQENDLLKITVHLHKDGAQEQVQMEFLPDQEQDVRQVLSPWIKA